MLPEKKKKYRVSVAMKGSLQAVEVGWFDAGASVVSTVISTVVSAVPSIVG